MTESAKKDLSRAFQFHPIGVVHSCFKEKFGIPRQPGLVSDATAILELEAPFNRREALSGLKGFSHIWIIFVFHESIRGEWRSTVRPPRLGGNQRIGVFASRSPFRPNPVGLSVVKLEKVEWQEGRCLLHLRGVDLLDGTPVLDIKPYLPYAEALTEAVGGFASETPASNVPVVFSELAEMQCTKYESHGILGLRQLIEQILSQDPRPAYYADSEKAGSTRQDRQRFGMRLYDFDLRWSIEAGQINVLELAPVSVD